MKNLKEVGVKVFILIIALLAANFVASFFLGFLMGIGGNVKVIGLSAIAFDPLITIAYILLYYFNMLFYQPTQRAQYFLFLLTLFLSFAVNFIQGALFLVAFLLILRKFRII